MVELGTGLCHKGPPKDHLPDWKAEKRAAEGTQGAPAPRYPFRPEAASETAVVIERALGLARLATRGAGESDDADSADLTEPSD